MDTTAPHERPAKRHIIAAPTMGAHEQTVARMDQLCTEEREQLVGRIQSMENTLQHLSWHIGAQLETARAELGRAVLRTSVFETEVRHALPGARVGCPEAAQAASFLRQDVMDAYAGARDADLLRCPPWEVDDKQVPVLRSNDYDVLDHADRADLRDNTGMLWSAPVTVPNGPDYVLKAGISSDDMDTAVSLFLFRADGPYGVHHTMTGAERDEAETTAGQLVPWEIPLAASQATLDDVDTPEAVAVARVLAEVPLVARVRVASIANAVLACDHTKWKFHAGFARGHLPAALTEE
jgi:hypothetical protein